MRIRRFALAMAGLSLVTGAAVAGQASAGVEGGTGAQGKTQAAATACRVYVGSVDATGVAEGNRIEATRPLTVSGPAGDQLFAVRASATWYFDNTDPAKSFYSGYILQGTNLYNAKLTYLLDAPGAASSQKVGTGWGSFSTIATSNYVGPKAHKFLYGLNDNGSLYRYNATTGKVAAFGSAPGYSGFRAITVIAETATYDTLLATTKAGALWTIHIPVTAPFKATLKLIRSTGFKGYDQLVADRCGANGTLLAGLNKATNKATVYAMSHANGASTVLQDRGTAEINAEPGVRFLRGRIEGPQLLGE
jgi:hypothetical protein